MTAFKARVALGALQEALERYGPQRSSIQNRTANSRRTPLIEDAEKLLK